MKPNSILLGIMAILMLISCSSDEKENLFPSVVSETSSEENVEVISNTSEGLWGNDKKVSLKQDLLIGKEYGSEKEMFGYIRIITFDDEGKIFIADSYELTIKVFDEQGNFINSFGREGNGPGEFITLDDIHWCRFDNTLYIPDRRNNRINKFSTDGKFIDALKTTKFKIRVMGIASFTDGRFMLTGMRFGGDFADYKIIVVDHSFENIIAEYGEDFPIHRIGMDYFPNFSDVGIISGTQLYYTSPSEYKIVLFDKNMAKSKIIKKSKPKMFKPQYVKGFYSDFNGLENIGMLNGNHIVGVSYSNAKDIPLFEQKIDFINFVENEIELGYQLDIFDGDFRFLTSVDIPPEKRLGGIDSKGRLYFIENEPFPRFIRCLLEMDGD